MIPDTDTTPTRIRLCALKPTHHQLSATKDVPTCDELPT